jgi:hypothetical protein
MSKPEPLPESQHDPAEDAEQFLRDFRRRMAEQGMPVRMANAPPDWEPAITLDVSGDEASAMVVQQRGERVAAIVAGLRNPRFEVEGE